MVFRKKQVHCKKKLGGWVILDNGTHATRSPAVIGQALKTILKEHIFCTLLHDGYQSGKTALVHCSEKQLRIDKPSDWPGTHSNIRILYKDKEQLWNQFGVKVVSSAGDTLCTTYPAKLLRLQRRANYRVEAPRGSTVLFMHKGEIFRGFYVQDISADGAMFFAAHKSVLAEGDILTDIALTFPGVGAVPERHLDIHQGRIRRIFRNEQRDICYGIQFQLTQDEEKLLLQYVRQRERELLRKGIAT